MYTGKLVFAQALDFLPLHTFRRCVQRYNGNRYIKSFNCQDQYRCMAFAQLAYRESLRDIEVCLKAQRNKLYHMGVRSKTVARSALANANEKRDWRIFADFAQSMIQIARPLYADEYLGLQLDSTVYALDSTTIDHLEHGFLRVQCETCHAEHLVAFSCKRRGFCPSCGARRMPESAALLVDEVLPHEPMRQWVLSVPFPLRFLFASQPKIMGKALGIVYRTIATHLTRKAGYTKTAAHTGASP